MKMSSTLPGIETPLQHMRGVDRVGGKCFFDALIELIS